MAADGPAVAVLPEGSRPWLAEAVQAGGGRLVGAAEADALVWADTADALALDRVLESHPGIGWVQLPWAGIEPYVDTVRRHADRRWTCGKGVYARPVAELALTLGLAGLRGVVSYARTDSWRAPGELGVTLRGARAVVLGAGGIAEALLPMLGALGAHTTVVRRSERPTPGADRTVALDHLREVLPGADLVVLALALTDETRGVVGAPELALMEGHAWLVNVARGGHVVTGDLVAALAERSIGGAGLDVTDPEPLPDGHPLWSAPNCLITPHVGNTSAMAVGLLSDRVTRNVGRFGAGEPLLGVVDPEAGY